jgi:hypothetical protein
MYHDSMHRKIVAAARITVAPKASTSDPSENALYAGQPIHAILSIHTSFHWGTSAGEKERKYLMQFDVEEMIKDWLVCGRKRGDFAAMVRPIHFLLTVSDQHPRMERRLPYPLR